MLKALAWKELRELLPLLSVALLVQLYLISTASGIDLVLLRQDAGAIPFVSDAFRVYLLIVAWLAAAVFGLWQTLWESGRGTYQYLLHRPARREALFGAKLLVGGSAVVVVTFLPMLALALWAATPGTHASPFEWSMTTESFQRCLQVPLVYLGAFASGVRPARWFGSRLLPLSGAMLLALLLQLAIGWIWPSILSCLAVEAIFVLLILFVANQRDYS